MTIGQRNGPHRNVLATLVLEDNGLKQFLELLVVPWFRKHAPWALTSDGRWFIHRYDPSMNGFSGSDRELIPIEQVRAALGRSPHIAHGPSEWPDREGPMLMLLAEPARDGMALQISPVPETLLLRQALVSRWYYGTTKGGQVVKDGGPHKPNRPWEDLGDSFAYWCGGVAPAKNPPHNRDPRPRARTSFNPFDASTWGREAGR